MKKTLQEMAKERGKYLLIESFILSIPKEELKERVEVFDSPRLLEGTTEKFKARGIVRQVDVTRYTKNLNERVYPKKLWERVLEGGFAEGTLSLMGHPEYDGDPKDICGVWHNFNVYDESSKADWYLIGEHGQTLLETLEAGGKVGISSVGFGEFETDGKTVKWDSYELERLGDAVINPSQGVYATYENVNTSDKDNKSLNEEIDRVKENINFESSLNTKSTNNKGNKTVIIEKQQGENIMSIEKIHADNWKNQIRLALTEAKKNENIQDAIENLQELYKDIPVEFVESRHKVEGAISNFQKVLENKIKEQTETLESKSEEVKILSEKLETTEKTLEEMSERYKKAKVILEKSGLKDIEGVVTLKEKLRKEERNFKLIKKDLSVLIEDTELRDRDISILLEDRSAMEYDIHCLVEDSGKMKEDIKKLVSLLKEAEKRIKVYENELEKRGFKFGEQEEDKAKEDKAKEDKKEESTKRKRYKVFSEKEDEKDMKDSKKADEEKDSKKADEVKEGRIKKYKFNFNEKEDSPEDKAKKDDEENKKEDKKESFKKKKVNEDYYTDDNYTYDDNNYYDDEDEEESVIYEFYKKEIKSFPALKEAKKEILRSKSLIEAVKKVEKFKYSADDKIIKLSNMKESVDSSWLGKRL